MKKITLAILSIAFLTACTVEKRLYNNGYSINWKTNTGKDKKEEITVSSSKKDKTEKVIKNENTNLVYSSKDNEKDIIIDKSENNSRYETKEIDRDIKLILQNKSVQSNKKIVRNETTNNEKLIPRYLLSKLRNDKLKKETKGETKCDLILLKNGDEISAKIEEITPNSIKYKRCDNLNGPLITIEKNKVFSVTYANGSKELMNKADNSKNNDVENENGEKQKGFAIVSLVTGILGIPILAIVFGLIQIYLIKDNPKKYGGKGMAIAGYALGVFWLLLIIALLTVA